MTFTDSHTHLYHPPFDTDRTEMIQRALDAGVTRLFMPNINIESTEGLMRLTAQYPDNCFAMMGLHPCDVRAETMHKELENVQHWLFSGKYPFCAVGEIGIDLYWDKSTLDIQKEAFEIQCKWAHELNLPICIHTRDSLDITIQLLKKRDLKGLRGIFHCFTGSVEQGREIIKLGYKMGIGGVVTYKNTHLRDTLLHIPIEHILLETDAPYLPPVPYRGKRNESAYLVKIAETLAQVYGKSVEEIAEITTHNSIDLFSR